jgi:hypothetical protein
MGDLESERSWEWTLPSGTMVVARMFVHEGTEEVRVDDQLACVAKRGQKPEGHVIRAGDDDLRVRFTRDDDCVLTISGDLVQPSKGPGARKGPDTVDPNARRRTRVLFTLGAMGALAVAFVYAVLSATAEDGPVPPPPSQADMQVDQEYYRQAAEAARANRGPQFNVVNTRRGPALVPRKP